MKGRSHRLPSTEPPDDWGDGSWTVDCVCGVTFDDGEEMVNCDECGVWVHTRCSRFVKGETSFACDKCKSEKSRGGGSNDNNEETEVAQLLVELPTKTVRMEPPPPVYPPVRRPPWRLWTEMPMEERVHVQGVPGGDPALFQGLSSVFTSELWKCTGYVPKKFNFRYREFPCWEESENPVDKGADVLFSLSKEAISCSPSVGLDREKKVSSKRMDAWEDGKGGRVVTGVFMQSCVKERNQLRQTAGHIGKRKKEDSGGFKDRSGKKKARCAEKEAENKKGFPPAADSLKSELNKNEVSKVPNIDFQDQKGKEMRENSHPQINAKPGPLVEYYNGEDTKHIVKAKLPTGSSRNDNISPSTHVKRENVSQDGFASVRQSPCADTSELFVAKVKDEVLMSDVDGLNNCNESHNLALRELGGDSSSAGIQSHIVKPAKREDGNILPDILDIRMPNASTCLVSPCSQELNADLKFEVNFSQNGANVEGPSSSVGDKKPLIQYARTSSGNFSQDLKQPDRSASSQDHRSADLDANSHTIANGEGIVSTCKEASHIEQESENKTNQVDDSSKLGSTNLGLQTPYPHKLAGGVSNTSPSSPTVVLNKSAVTATAGQKPSMYSVKQRLKVNVNPDCKKESVATGDASTDEKVKSLPISRTKPYHSPRNPSLATFSKHGSSEAKEESHCRSLKAGRVENAGPSDAREDGTQSRAQGGRVMENKHASSALPRKSEKISQLSSQLSTKVVDQSSTVPATVSPTLSDEEFALLLHQQLNSSPRVSRVPRMRQASNMAQLASSTSVGMPMKRTSSSGGKDHILFSRKRYKDDLYRDAIRTNRELSDEIKKSDRLSLTDQRQKDSVVTEDGLAKRDGCINSDMIISGKNSALPVSNGSPKFAVEAVEKHSLSIRNSPKSGSDDDVTVPTDSTPLTLPALINEIMSRGKRMTYEELCDTVLPHWHNLRKHNGERYAYASHSQAVLDCLRNRSEWSHLVDRGPKTSSGKKKRKHDSDMREVESDDEDVRDASSKVLETKGAESKRDDFPKGKRNARKRRLTAQGRGMTKDARKKRKAEVTTDEDIGDSSPSSEGSESFMSEDGSQNGDETSRPVDSDASSSSTDEA